MIIAIFGATGNMMIKSISGILNIDNSIKIRILTRSASSKKVKELIRKHQNRIEVIEGSINNKSDVEKMVDHATYVINAAATIPPFAPMPVLLFIVIIPPRKRTNSRSERPPREFSFRRFRRKLYLYTLSPSPFR